MRQLSAKVRSVFTTAASFPHSREAACNSLCINILPVSRLDARIYGDNRQSISRKSHESKILRGAPEKNRNCHQSRNSFVPKILRVNSLESRICEGYRVLECTQFQQNQDFANFDVEKIFALSESIWRVGIPSAFTSGRALRLRLIFALAARRSILAQDDTF